MSDERRADEPVLDEERAATPDEAVAETADDDEDLSELIGAYVLDALPDEERAAFERYLERSPAARDEVRQLRPVVALLSALFEREPDGAVAEATPALAADARAKVIAAAASERKTALIDPVPAPGPVPTAAASVEARSPRARTIRTTPDPTGPFGVERTLGRRRARPGTGPDPLAQFRNVPVSWLVASLSGVIAIGAIIWALALQGRIETKDREIRAQAAQISELRRNANATAFTLAAGEGAAEASGTLLFSLRDRIGVLYVRNLPRLDEGRVYQIWYLRDESAAPAPGGTFRVDRNGNGVLAVDPDTPTFDAIAVTEEPQGGSEAPTSDILMQGRLGGAAG